MDIRIFNRHESHDVLKNSPIRRFRGPALVVVLAALVVLMSGGGRVHAVVGLQQVVTGLANPVAITHAGDGSGRLFITLQDGRIVIFNGATVLPVPFLDIRTLVLSGGERGLLSVAFHPNYPTTPFFYVDYTNLMGNTIVARYRVSTTDPNLANSSSRRAILRQSQPFANHNGGQLQFGPDGFLYIALGDGGSAGDPGNRAQNLGTLLGKILRVDVNGALPYAIPPTNPFVGMAGTRPEIWAYGLRNPWRFSFDRANGNLYIADVGQAQWEEINFELNTNPGGRNYGWRRMEGRHCFNPAVNCNDGTLTLPVLEYSHAVGESVTGGYVYRGTQVPELVGRYVYGDFVTGRIWAAGRVANVLLMDTTLRISTFGEDENGELYVADYTTGTIFRFIQQ